MINLINDEYRIDESTLGIQENLFLDVLWMTIRDILIQMSAKLTRERRGHQVKISNKLKFLQDMYTYIHLPLYLKL